MIYVIDIPEDGTEPSGYAFDENGSVVVKAVADSLMESGWGDRTRKVDKGALEFIRGFLGALPTIEEESII